MTIGVALSNTPAGDAALRAAVQEAVLRGQPLAVLHVVDTSEHAADGALNASVSETVRERLDAAGAPEGLSWELVTGPTRGSLPEALLELADQAAIDLMVIGSRKRSAVGKLLMGSTVQRVLLDASVPVLVTKA
ncbi:universal stress protein [Epidermidibacterium keratini]|nr:universal stress protein [Epidermidibacterium keratini]